MEELLRRRLRALGHFDPDGFDVNDEKKYANLVLWLEDQKIRHYSLEDRTNMRKAAAATEDVEASKATRATNPKTASESTPDKWIKSYLGELGCCDTNELYKTKESRLLWLLGHAVKAEYMLKVEQLKKLDEGGDGGGGGGRLHHELKAVGIDVGSPEFSREVSSLAASLKLQCHPSDPLLTLHACCIHINKATEEHNNRNKEDVNKQDRGQLVKLSEHPMGVSSSMTKLNPGLSKALKILKLLQVKDLREVQDGVNAAIESIQRMTANPKTDTRLGKVGR